MTKAFDKPSIFCIIPAFNEEGNLLNLSSRLVKVFLKYRISFKILFILQGNKIAVDIVKRIKKKYQNIDYLYYPNALGIGTAYRIGFKNLNKKFSHVLTLDADLNHQPEEIPKFFEALSAKNPDVIIGSRFVSGGNSEEKRFWKKITSLLANMIINRLFDISVADKSSGFRLINTKVIKKVIPRLEENGYPAYMEFILLSIRNGFSITEVPITYIARKWGKSKMKKYDTLVNYLKFILRIPSFRKYPN
jgi:dolichol-phosphate mannosyltransferase